MFWVLEWDPAGLVVCRAPPKYAFFPTRGAFPNRCGKLSKVTGMDGVLFGRLVREKRGIEGLSQDGLGEKSGLTKAG